MPEVSAVSVSPTWAVPLMVGAPVAGLLAPCAMSMVTVATTGSIGYLGSDLSRATNVNESAPA